MHVLMNRNIERLVYCRYTDRKSFTMHFGSTPIFLYYDLYLKHCLTQHTTFISDFTIHISSTPTFLYYDCIWTLPHAGHYTFISDFTIHIGSTPTFLYFDLYPNTAYAGHYVYFELYYPYQQYTNLFIFRIFSICIWTLRIPTQHNTFISDYTIFTIWTATGFVISRLAPKLRKSSPIFLISC